MSGLKMRAFLAGTLMIFVATAGWAIDNDTPYQGIVDRNVFALKPPTPPPPPPDNRPPPPKIWLTGITTILGKKLVLLKTQGTPRPGVKGEDESYTLTVGQRQGDVEVLEINERDGIVKVNNSGVVTNLTWEGNGIKVATPAPAAAAAPGAPANTAFAPGAPGAMPHGTTRTVPSTFRPTRPSPSPNANYPGSTGNYPGSTGYGGTGTALPGLGNAASPINATKNWPPEPSDPDHQTILDAAYKQRNAAAIADGRLPDIPGDNPLVETPPPNAPVQQNPRQNFNRPGVPPY